MATFIPTDPLIHLASCAVTRYSITCLRVYFRFLLFFPSYKRYTPLYLRL